MRVTEAFLSLATRKRADSGAKLVFRLRQTHLQLAKCGKPYGTIRQIILAKGS